MTKKFTEKSIAMNLQNNFTKLDKNLQEVLEKWDKKILPFLPECLDGLARKTGIIQRKRGVRSASDLLKMLFLYACSSISFRVLAAAAYALAHSDSFSILKYFMPNASASFRKSGKQIPLSESIPTNGGSKRFVWVCRKIGRASCRERVLRLV